MRFSSLSTLDAHLKRPWILLSIGFVLLLARAWPRLLYPEVWNEDGTDNLSGFLQNGLSNLSEPVGGYLHVVPKLVTMLASSISISWYPMISTVLAWGVTLAVFCLVATAPIRLQGGGIAGGRLLPGSQRPGALRPAALYLLVAFNSYYYRGLLE